jgi:exodeoxyribonuclease VII small subunit
MSKSITFEEAMASLESAVARLEGGNLSLEESIKEFESAVKLIGLCEKKLGEAKQRVMFLTEAPDGTVKDEPFIAEDET